MIVGALYDVTWSVFVNRPGGMRTERLRFLGIMEDRAAFEPAESFVGSKVVKLDPSWITNLKEAA